MTAEAQTAGTLRRSTRRYLIAMTIGFLIYPTSRSDGITFSYLSFREFSPGQWEVAAHVSSFGESDLALGVAGFSFALAPDWNAGPATFELGPLGGSDIDGNPTGFAPPTITYSEEDGFITRITASQATAGGNSEFMGLGIETTFLGVLTTIPGVQAEHFVDVALDLFPVDYRGLANSTLVTLDAPRGNYDFWVGAEALANSYVGLSSDPAPGTNFEFNVTRIPNGSLAPTVTLMTSETEPIEVLEVSLWSGRRFEIVSLVEHTFAAGSPLIISLAYTGTDVGDFPLGVTFLDRLQVRTSKGAVTYWIHAHLVPEPASSLLLGALVIGAGFLLRKRTFIA